VEPSDGELIVRGRAGDREALQALAERYQGRILRVVVGMLRNSEDASDIVQEAFVRAFRNLGKFKGDSSFYTWLYRIAVNLTIDHRRKDGKRTMVEFDENAPPATDVHGHGAGRSPFDPFEQVRNRELGRMIFAAIEELTPDHRAVILLREVEGLSYEEISQVLECSLGTVMSRLHYARKKLQARLGELL